MGRPARRGARRRLLAAALLVLASAACGESSTVDPDATVVLSGEVRAPGGGPLPQRPVRLASATGGDEVALAFLTLGLACAGDACDDDLRSTQTDAAGRYRLELQGRDTQTAFGNVRRQALSAAAAPRPREVSGASVTARFVVQTERLALPALQLVDPALTVGAAPGRVGASWRTTAGGPYALSFETDDVVPVWRVTTAGTSATVDARVLEGTAGRAVLSGGRSDEAVGTDVDVTWRSPGLGYAATSGAPLSRGLPCTYGAGSAAVQEQDCGLTDGDLFHTSVAPTACPPPDAGATAAPPCRAPTAVVALPEPLREGLVVVRGCVGSCTVEVSADGRAFRRAAAVADAFGAVRLPTGAVRAVRVGLGRDGLREVSVWGPAEAEPGLRPVRADAVEELREPYAEPGAGGIPTVVVVLAAALCGAGVLGTGYLWGRRAAR